MNSAVSPISNITDWTTVCEASDLITDAGVCVWYAGEQVAIFKDSKSNAVYAISNYDPIGKANVLSRGILGSINGRVVVASPLYKQHFCLESGECLEQECQVPRFAVQIHGGAVQLAKHT